MRVVFMGTPDFAAQSLLALLQNDFNVVAVFCQPDKPKGRGQSLKSPPVKVLALSHGIPVYQPATLKSKEAALLLRDLKPEVIAVTAYGKLLPLDILEIPPLGCVNVHGSLLPLYRGAAPIQWSVLNGEKETGVTTMLMAAGMDTGNILLQERVAIGEDETSAELFERLSVIGGELLCRTINLLYKQEITSKPQEHDKATLAPMLSKDKSPISFDQPVQTVHNLIRGLSDWPCASCVIEGQRVKLYKSHVTQRKTDAAAGTLLVEDGGEFLVACKEGGVISILEVQGEGGKRMKGADFLRGKRFSKHVLISSTELTEDKGEKII